MLNARLAELTDHTFRRLAALLDPVQPRINLPPVNLSVGTPSHKPPPFVAKIDRKSTRLNSSHIQKSRMPSSA